jgi:hypothetical protein
MLQREQQEEKEKKRKKKKKICQWTERSSCNIKWRVCAAGRGTSRVEVSSVCVCRILSELILYTFFFFFKFLLLSVTTRNTCSIYVTGTLLGLTPVACVIAFAT